MSKEQANKEFDKAINSSYYKARILLTKKYGFNPDYEQINFLAEKLRRGYETEKALYNLTFNFTAKDWRYFRTPKYWEIWHGCADDFSRKQYLLTCVNYYLTIKNK